MNAQNIDQKPRVTRESKNKIRVEFDRTPLKQRLKEKFLTVTFFQKVVLKIFQYVLMIGIAYVILQPFISIILDSFKSRDDFVDVTVFMIPKNVTFDLYRAIFAELEYFRAFGNTFTLALSLALLQTLTCCLIGYGFAKFKFRGRNLIFMLVMLTMIVPHQTLREAMLMKFRNFDILGIVRLFKGGGMEFFGWNVKELGPGVASFFESLNVLPDKIILSAGSAGGTASEVTLGQSGINLGQTYAPLMLLSVTGLAFKNGLYIFLLRQFFRGIPDELEESAYMDGCGTFRTFFQIILPLSIPMMVTVFLFAFCWQWTDNFYINLVAVSDYDVTKRLLVNIVGADTPASLVATHPGQEAYVRALYNTTAITVIAPLVILYAFCQNFLVQGIEHSGIAN
ncbi:MAG: carbohydrate ABC transporter permease [Clostridia bacterium]|nr:carbohydrate ABC transporter permease [Clostridia bacterium]